MTIITRRRFMAGVGVSAMLAAMGPYSSIFAAKTGSIRPLMT